MPTVTVDQHTLQIDGKRLWIVSGTVAYTGAPSELWRDRLLAAKRAGLNTIVVPAIWAEHEPIQGKFDFKGDRSLATFLRLAADLRLHVILRVGPHADDALDLGGIPPWLTASLEPSEPLRAPGPAFMASCAAWLTALAKEIAPLQATRARTAGPIIAVQLEHRWFVGDDDLAEQYMGGLARFLRERNIDVPVLNTNNLFATAEGQLECWAGSEDLHAITRQLGVAIDNQPRIIADVGAERLATWGETPPPQNEHALAFAVACVLAAGGQFNVAAFARGMRFASTSGRASTARDRFLTPGCAEDVFDESGTPTAAYSPVRRLCTFASSFARLFHALDPQVEPAAITPAPADPPAAKSKRAVPPAVIYKPGDQGAVIFAFGKPGDALPLTLSDGAHANITLPSTGIAWVVQDAHLFARTTLDLCTLSLFAFQGSTLICFGSAGAQGFISINSAVIEVAVPSGRTPHIETLEGVTIVVCNEQQIDESLVLDDRFIVGTTAIDGEGNPTAAKAVACTIVHTKNGEVEARKAAAQRTTSRAPAIRSIECADTMTYVDGSSDRFVRIDAPAPLAQLGAPTGYVWLRAELNAKSAHKARVACFDVADRAHIFAGGLPAALLGVASGATGCVTSLQLRKGKQHIVALVDNMGHSATDAIARAPKALGHIEEVKAFKAGTPKIDLRTPANLLSLGQPVLGLHRGDVTDPHRLAWSFTHRRK
ncbi:MAG: beta-galactosidase, partial [Phycisphaerales bacterium]|nr:beta-galactosidase [Phycisphaerales bacterium]